MSLAPGISEKFPQGLERNTYFFGKLLTAEDFNLEQAYFLAREALINAGLLGPGIITGLGLKEFKDEEETISFILEAGLAIDPQGKLLFVPEDRRLKLKVENRAETLGVFLVYEECPREPTVTVCDPKECQYNRVREGVRVELAEKNEKAVRIATLKLVDSSYQALPSPKPPLPEKELPSERLLNLRELAQSLLGVFQELRALEEKVSQIPRLSRREIRFLFRPGNQRPQELVYGFKGYPLTQILNYLPLRYEISPEGPEIEFEKYRPLLERGEIYLAAHPAKEFFSHEPPPEAPEPPIRPVPLAPIAVIRSRPMIHFRHLRKLPAKTKVRAVSEIAHKEGIDLKIDPRLSPEVELNREDIFVYTFFYPVFDGTLLPYLALDFREASKGKAYFHFDWASFQKEEPELAEMFIKHFKGIPFRIVFVSEY